MSEHETPENPQSNDPEAPDATRSETPAATPVPSPEATPVGAPEATPVAAPEQVFGAMPESADPGQPLDPRQPAATPVNPAPPQAGPAGPATTHPAPAEAGFVPGGHHLPAAHDHPAPAGGPEHGYAPQGPTPVPAGEEFGPNKKLPTGAIIGIVAAGVVVLLVIAAAVIVPLLGRGSSGASSGADGDEPAPAASTPGEYVEAYLTAISEGDAEEASKYVDTSGYSSALLTDEVLKASLELGEIDDISVGKEGKGKYGDIVVPATFTVGGTEVTREFEIHESSYDGSLTMYNAAIRVSTYSFDDIGLTVNGEEVPDDALVFPGMYDFGTTIEAFTVEGESTLVIADEKSEEALISLRPVLSEEGVATYRELVSASLRECLAMKTLNTPCGMDVTGMEKDGYTVVDGTVTRTMRAEGEAALAGLIGEVSDRAVVSTYESFGIDISLEAQNAAGQRAPFTTLLSGLLSPKVDFAADEPKVVWE